MAQWTVTVALVPVVVARQAPGVRIARWGGVIVNYCLSELCML